MYWWVLKTNFKKSVCRERKETGNICTAAALGKTLAARDPQAAGLTGLGLPAPHLPTLQMCLLAGNASSSALPCPCGDQAHPWAVHQQAVLPLSTLTSFMSGVALHFRCLPCKVILQVLVLRTKWNWIVLSAFWSIIHNIFYLLFQAPAFR